MQYLEVEGYKSSLPMPASKSQMCILSQRPLRCCLVVVSGFLTQNTSVQMGGSILPKIEGNPKPTSALSKEKGVED